jgi:hypothetical protein
LAEAAERLTIVAETHTTLCGVNPGDEKESREIEVINVIP